MEARTKRQLAMLETRRGMVIDAAMRVADRVGLPRTSIREIAKEAGYTPGALYAFFRNKREVFVVLARQAIVQLSKAVQSTRALKGQEMQLLQVKGDAWINHLIQNSRDWEVISQVVLGPLHKDLEPHDAAELHRALRESMAPLGQALMDQGLAPDQLEQELESMLSMALGILVSQDGTRLQPPALAPQQLFASYLTSRTQVLFTPASAGEGDAKPAKGGGKKQVDLFG